MSNRKILLTAMAGAAASIAAPTHALTVGDAKVLSYTDQPLRVLIPLNAQGWEWKSLWASAQTYQRGLGLTAMLYKPQGEKTDGFIEIRSASPVSEPIVDLQITFDTGHRTTVHRTPILIDVPNESGKPQDKATSGIPGRTSASSNLTLPPGAVLVDPSEVHSKAPVVATDVKASEYKDPPLFPPQSLRASQGNGVSTERRIPIPKALPTPASIEKRSASNVEYHVKNGDGLYAIVNKFKPALWSHDEAMQHVYDNNRHAFSGKKYNTLKAGVVLSLDFGVITEKSETPPHVQEDVRKSSLSLSSKEFTEADLLAAVQRHRMEKLQAELQRLGKPTK